MPPNDKRQPHGALFEAAQCQQVNAPSHAKEQLAVGGANLAPWSGYERPLCKNSAGALRLPAASGHRGHYSILCLHENEPAVHHLCMH